MICVALQPPRDGRPRRTLSSPSASQGAVEHPPFFQLFAVAAVVMGLSQTIAKERIFASVRDRCGGRESWLGYLVSCPYCVSHWIAFVLVPLTSTYAVDVPHAWGPVATIARWFLSSIFLTVIAAFLRIGFYLVDEGQGLIRREIAKVETETKVVERVARDGGRDAPWLDDGRLTRP
jgi:hypothetical protein